MILEEVAAMAATFLLLTSLVQLTAAMTARSAADAAVAAATRRIALPDGDIPTEELRLTEAIGALVPGAHQVSVSLTADDRIARGTARFRWIPPGPVLVPFAIVVTSEVPIAFAP